MGCLFYYCDLWCNVQSTPMIAVCFYFWKWMLNINSLTCNKSVYKRSYRPCLTGTRLVTPPSLNLQRHVRGRSVRTTTSNCDVCLLLITASSSLFHEPDARSLQWNAIRNTAGLYCPLRLYSQCAWWRRDAKVRDTLAFLWIICKLSMLCIRKFCHDFAIVACHCLYLKMYGIFFLCIKSMRTWMNIGLQ